MGWTASLTLAGSTARVGAVDTFCVEKPWQSEDMGGNRTEVKVNHALKSNLSAGYTAHIAMSTRLPHLVNRGTYSPLSLALLVTSAIPAENILETSVGKHHKVVRSVKYACPMKGRRVRERCVRGDAEMKVRSRDRVGCMEVH